MAVKIDTRGAVNASKRLRQFATSIEQVVPRAASDLARRIGPEASRQIRSTYNINATRLRESLTVTRTGDAVVLTGKDRPTGLTQFGAKASKRNGVTVTIRKDRAPVQFRHAFAATGRGSNRQVFQRVGKARLPIEAMYGPSPAEQLRNPEIRDHIVEFSQRTIAAEIRRLLKRF